MHASRAARLRRAMAPWSLGVLAFVLHCCGGHGMVPSPVGPTSPSGGCVPRAHRTGRGMTWVSSTATCSVLTPELVQQWEDDIVSTWAASTYTGFGVSPAERFERTTLVWVDEEHLGGPRAPEYVWVGVTALYSDGEVGVLVAAGPVGRRVPVAELLERYRHEVSHVILLELLGHMDESAHHDAMRDMGVQ